MEVCVEEEWVEWNVVEKRMGRVHALLGCNVVVRVSSQLEQVVAMQVVVVVVVQWWWSKVASVRCLAAVYYRDAGRLWETKAASRQARQVTVRTALSLSSLFSRLVSSRLSLGACAFVALCCKFKSRKPRVAGAFVDLIEGVGEQGQGGGGGSCGPDS